MSAELTAIHQTIEAAQTIPTEAWLGLVIGATAGLRLSLKLWSSINEEGGCLNACLVAGTIGLLPPTILGAAGFFAGLGLHQLLVGPGNFPLQ